MRDEDLIRMANQIGDYFNAYPEDEAVAGIANHITMFWDPRMKVQLRSIAAANQGALAPLVDSAVRTLAAAN